MYMYINIHISYQHTFLPKVIITNTRDEILSNVAKNISKISSQVYNTCTSTCKRVLLSMTLDPATFSSL